MGHCFSKKLLPPKLNAESSSEISESEDSEKESVKKDGGSVKVDDSIKKASKPGTSKQVGKTAGFSKSDPVKGTGTRSGTRSLTRSLKKVTAVRGRKTPANSKQTGSPSSSSKTGGSKASPRGSPSHPGAGIKAKAASAASSRSSKTPRAPPKSLRTPPKATVTAGEVKRNKTPNVVARVAPQPIAKNLEPIKQAPPPPPSPPLSQFFYQERPRVLQLNNGNTLNLPNSKDYTRQLNDAHLQAQIKSYFEEMMAQIKLNKVDK